MCPKILIQEIVGINIRTLPPKVRTFFFLEVETAIQENYFTPSKHT
jgi:hypothetical protein